MSTPASAPHPPAARSFPLQRALTQGARAPALHPGWATFLLSVLGGPTAALVITAVTLHRLELLRSAPWILVRAGVGALLQLGFVVWVVLDPDALRPLADRLTEGSLRALLRHSQHLLGALVWLSTWWPLREDLRLADAAGLRTTSPWRISLVAFAIALGLQASVGALAAIAR